MSYPKYVKHGYAPKHLKRSNIYRRWQHMVQRCINPNDRDYPRYGGRGISVCDRWRDFANFLADMGAPPTKSHSIDRLDVNGDYSPGNCRWANPKEQANNRTNTRFLTIDGVTKPLSVWCAEYNIGPKTVLYRLKAGMSDKDSITKPLRRVKNERN